jgi:hypothetical protein
MTLDAGLAGIELSLRLKARNFNPSPTEVEKRGKRIRNYSLPCTEHAESESLLRRPADEFEYGTVKELGLLPIDRMPTLRRDHS